MRKNQNDLSWLRYMEALNGAKDMASNTGVRVAENKIVTYTQNKLGLSAYYDKRVVDKDRIHTSTFY